MDIYQLKMGSSCAIAEGKKHEKHILVGLPQGIFGFCHPKSLPRRCHVSQGQVPDSTTEISSLISWKLHSQENPFCLFPGLVVHTAGLSKYYTLRCGLEYLVIWMSVVRNQLATGGPHLTWVVWVSLGTKHPKSWPSSAKQPNMHVPWPRHGM